MLKCVNIKTNKKLIFLKTKISITNYDRNEY
uniref:Uncharacterized protein n=1 Tax=viral metagenome TaxID=1070528 RepID=A0A6C0HT37_9ZZZZ